MLLSISARRHFGFFFAARSRLQVGLWRPKDDLHYSPDRKGEHPRSHLSNSTGTLQADGYAGFDQICEAGHTFKRRRVGRTYGEKFYGISRLRTNRRLRLRRWNASWRCMPLLGTAKLNGIDPESYLRNMLSRIAEHLINRIEELLPWNLAADPICFQSCKQPRIDSERLRNGGCRAGEVVACEKVAPDEVRPT
jgi:transposase IS66-like protein/transposase IS66 family protein